MKRSTLILLACKFVVSVALLALAHFVGDPSWVRQHLSSIDGGDGILWQVQTTFLSVGFAGLAIAAQLFAEAPLAIGASRVRVLEYIKAGELVGVGLVANAVIAVETIWLPSHLGVLGVVLAWFTPTVVMLVTSTTRLMQLFGNPSRLDEMVRSSLVETLSNRLRGVSRDYAGVKKQLEGLSVADWSAGFPRASSATLGVPVPEAGRVIKTIRPNVVRQAVNLLSLRATEGGLMNSDITEVYDPPRITINVEPGDRTRLGETAFRVVTSKPLDEATVVRAVHLLQSSIEFEPTGWVTPYEETDREIANLKDAIGTNLRSGALATAGRALELLGHVVLGVWMAEPAHLDSSRRAAFTRRDWLFRSIGEAEQDALLSPRVAGMFVTAAMSRALEAPRIGSTEYVDECLRSFTRLWSDVLRYGGPEFDSVPPRLITCVQNLAAYSYSVSDEREDLNARGTWAIVELVKLALDANRFDAARMAAQELDSLFEFDREGTGRSHVQGGQLVLAGWIDYLINTKENLDPAHIELRKMVTPHGSLEEIIAARGLVERGATPFSRWDWWEINSSASNRVQVLQLSGYIDRAQLAVLASSYGSLPPADDEEVASDYKRFLRILEESDKELNTGEENLKHKLTQAITKWDSAEDTRLAQEPLSAERIVKLGDTLRETLAERPRLAAVIPVVEDVPTAADTSRPILGMNVRIPRHYLVDKVFNHTYADPAELGRNFSQGFIEGEDRKILDALRSLKTDHLEATGASIRQRIESLGSEAKNYVLVTPYGGLDDIYEWYSADFGEALGRVTHIETGVLENEAILFDRRKTISSCRRPEEKTGLKSIEGTSIALGVFEDVLGGDEPQVRLEAGEYLVVWPGNDPRIVRFGGQQILE